MVYLYTIKNCPYCQQLKENLTNLKIGFTEIDVDLQENQEIYNKLYQVTKSDMVPIIRVGKQLLVPEVSFKTINEASEIVKKLIL